MLRCKDRREGDRLTLLNGATGRTLRSHICGATTHQRLLICADVDPDFSYHCLLRDVGRMYCDLQLHVRSAGNYLTTNDWAFAPRCAKRR
jgi:hypothetical protein